MELFLDLGFQADHASLLHNISFRLYTIEAMRILTHRGADPNSKGHRGNTALHIATCQNVHSRGTANEEVSGFLLTTVRTLVSSATKERLPCTPLHATAIAPCFSSISCKASDRLPLQKAELLSTESPISLAMTMKPPSTPRSFFQWVLAPKYLPPRRMSTTSQASMGSSDS
ncbi:hypothetical protein K469DRAFT_301022 [Zopfia rhizophila CBS 207.26]|uniref:Uncharacterized protein n=1 Tax=Zopfia rhizophila CBS 207.26 TaxID=1314779 RepID=A0A6A6DNK2_9PEZI|nr:hypothetical protein K469DRAFT_301022 [Zopfia rhizophila CBS 207.26]